MIRFRPEGILGRRQKRFTAPAAADKDAAGTTVGGA